MRKSIKTISFKPEKFIPTSQQGLSEGAKEVEDRPLYFMWRKLGRDDKFNIQSLGGFEREATPEGPEVSLTKMGDVAKYIWDKAVVSVHNVLLDDQALEKVEGMEKDKLWYTDGLDEEIMEIIAHIQKESFLTEAEAKN